MSNSLVNKLRYVVLKPKHRIFNDLIWKESPFFNSKMRNLSLKNIYDVSQMETWGGASSLCLGRHGKGKADLILFLELFPNWFLRKNKRFQLDLHLILFFSNCLLIFGSKSMTSVWKRRLTMRFPRANRRAWKMNWNDLLALTGPPCSQRKTRTQAGTLPDVAFIFWRLVQDKQWPKSYFNNKNM